MSSVCPCITLSHFLRSQVRKVRFNLTLCLGCSKPAQALHCEMKVSATSSLNALVGLEYVRCVTSGPRYMKSLPTLKSTACTRCCAASLGGRAVLSAHSVVPSLVRRLLKVQPGEFYLQPAPRRDDRSDSEEEETLDGSLIRSRSIGLPAFGRCCDISVPILGHSFMSKQTRFVCNPVMQSRNNVDLH